MPIPSIIPPTPDDATPPTSSDGGVYSATLDVHLKIYGSNDFHCRLHLINAKFVRKLEKNAEHTNVDENPSPVLFNEAIFVNSTAFKDTRIQVVVVGSKTVTALSSSRRSLAGTISSRRGMRRRSYQ